MSLTRNATIISMAGFLIGLTGPADAARQKAKQNQAQTVSGMVVHHRGKPVAGAYVHVVHHHKSRHHAGAANAANGVNAMAKARPKAGVAGAANAANAMAKAKPKAAVAGAHHGIMTGANGTFSMKMKGHKAGMVMLVAHKKGVGKGHARAVAGANVTIRLHKHHHQHA